MTLRRVVPRMLSRRTTVVTALGVALILALAMTEIAVGRPDFFDDPSRVYGPYTVTQESYAPYTAAAEKYAPYEAGPVIHERDMYPRPYAPFTAAPAARDEAPWPRQLAP